MEKKQLRNIILIVLLPIIFAGVGYFGMKVFLSGTGPNTVMPEVSTQESTQQDEGKQAVQLERGSQEGTLEGTGSSASDDVSGAKSENTSDEKAESTKEAVVISEPEEPKTQVDPTQKTTTEEVAKPVQGKQYTFDSLNFFSLQVGSYSAASNAENHVSQLSESGINAYIFYGNNYKVMTGVSASREGVEQIKRQIVESVPDAFVKGMMIVPDVLQYKSEANGFDQFKAIAGTYYGRLEHHVAFLSTLGGLSEAQAVTEIESERGEIADLQTQIEQFDGDAVFNIVLEKIKGNLKQVDQNLGQIINNEFVKDSVFEIYTDEILKYNELTK